MATGWCDHLSKMSFRNKVRSTAIRAATVAQLDELAFHLNAGLRRASYGVVVSMHETPQSFADRFRQQLEWVTQRFCLVTLEQFAQLWPVGGNPPVFEKPPALFTFDDGRESNYRVAAPLLESFGTRGVFFVVPSFAECKEAQALQFYRARINPSSSGNEGPDFWKPMTPDQIAELAARGHSVGSHTLTHANLKGLTDEQLELEIGGSARKIHSWTGKSPDAFAWTFAWDAIDHQAWQIVQHYHRFCFAPCPGMVNARRDLPAMIWRREIEVRYSAAELRFLWSGLGDHAWRKRRAFLRKSVCGLGTTPLHALAARVK